MVRKSWLVGLFFLCTAFISNAQSDANQWTWIGGDSSNTSLLADQLGVWGTKGVASPSNYPSARTRAVNWTDSDGNYWLYGGRGYDGNGNTGLLNDLWKYNPNTKEWTWVSGDNAVNTIGVYSGEVKPGARQGAIGWIDATGNLWLFSGNGYASNTSTGYLNDLWRFNIVNSQWIYVRGSTTINAGLSSGNPASREGAVSWATSDNKLWMMGGLTPNGRINDLWNYNPSSNSWSFVKGCTCANQQGNYGSKGISAFSNVPGARNDAVSFSDNEGFLWLFGGQGIDSARSTGFLNDLWKYDIATNEWTWFSGSKRVNQGGIYGVKGNAAAANTPGARLGGVGWTDNVGRFYLFGGSSNAAFSDVWVYDPATSLWTWKAGSSAGSPAALHGTKQVPNATNLPGGTSGAIAWKTDEHKILIFGGTSLNNRRVNLFSNELWDFDLNNNNWTWQDGSSRFIAAPQYGVRGVASVNNQPGARRLAATWKDKDGHFWMFGGQGFADSLSAGNLNDLWKYNPSTKEWTWIAGSSRVNQNGVYGTRGVASPNNIPGGRYGSAGWVDTSGNIWIFGGTQGSALFNDLWQYNPLTDRWTWFRGSNGGNAQGVYGSRGVGAVANTPSAKEGTVYGVDQDGNLWLFGGRGISLTNDFGLMNDLWRFTPSTTQWSWMGGSGTRNAPPFYGTQGVAGSAEPGGRQYAGGSIDTDGNLYLFGGDGIDELGTQGLLNDLWKYNLVNNQWIWLKGNSSRNNLSVASAKGVAANSNNPGGRAASSVWTDGLGNLWLLGGNGLGTTTGADFLQDLWKYDPLINHWTWVEGSNATFPSYQYGEKNKASFSNQPLARNGNTAWYGSDGALYFSGGLGRFNNTNTQLYYNDLWKYQLPCAVKADFQMSDTALCLNGNSFTFTNTTKSVASALTYEWIFGDGTTAGSKNFLHSYNQEGLFEVKLIARQGACVDSLTKTVRVLKTPAILTVNGSADICEGESVQLKANSGKDFNYAWQKDGEVIATATDSSYRTSQSGTYKVTVTNKLTGCSSVSEEISVNVKPRPAAPDGTAAQVFCKSALVSDLVANGSVLSWYDASTAGNPLSASTALKDGSIYYVSQTNNGCESENRLSVAVTIKNTPAPQGNSLQQFCFSASVVELQAVGADIEWYSTQIGGSPLTSNQQLSDQQTVYASQSIDGCRSDRGLEVKVKIQITPAPSGSSLQTFCQQAKLKNLSADGELLKWYNAPTGGSAIDPEELIANNQVYYASQTKNGCESAERLAVRVLIYQNAAPPFGNQLQSFCGSAQISDLVLLGSNIRWYTAPFGGVPVSSTTLLENNAVYYASQTINGCESLNRTAITASLLPAPPKPVISVNGFELISSAATGNQWYSSGIALNAVTQRVFRPTEPGTYTVQVKGENGCLSPMSESVNYISGGGEYVRLQPNPVRDYLDLFWMLREDVQLNARIYSSTGLQLSSHLNISSGQRISVSHLQPGMYTIRLLSADGKRSYVYRFVKML